MCGYESQPLGDGADRVRPGPRASIFQFSVSVHSPSNGNRKLKGVLPKSWTRHKSNLECGGRGTTRLYQESWRRRFGFPRRGDVRKSQAGRALADTSAPRSAKAASPVGLIRPQPPSAAALHKVLGCIREWTFSTPSRACAPGEETWQAIYRCDNCANLVL